LTKYYLRYAALFLVISAPAAYAQVATGTITGYVHDATEAAIVGAKVSIVESETG